MKHQSPPPYLLRFFKWFCHTDLHIYVEGDLLELYQEMVTQSGQRMANIKFFIEVIKLFRPGIIRPFSRFKNSNNLSMLSNYIKVSFRNLFKHKGYAAINILGLAIGLTIAFVTTLYVFEEISYDQFHTDSHRIYRVSKRYFNGDRVVETVPFRSYLLDKMYDDIPAVESITTLKPLGQDKMVIHNHKRYVEKKLAFADSNFFDFFTFEMIHGSPNSALSAPYTAVISERKANEYFNGAQAIGETITIESAYDKIGFEAKITGIFKDMPKTSHFQYDFLISMATGKLENDKRGIYSFPLKYGYFKLHPLHTIDEVSALIPTIEKEYAPSFYADYDMHLLPQPLPDIHLKSHKEKEMEVNGDINRVYIFSAVALLTLLIACFNYINLATARAVEKFNEVGVRKAIGASRGQLIFQFLTESLLTSFLALIMACHLTIAILPTVNNFLGQTLSLSFGQYYVFIAFVLITFLVGIVSGIYPALILSRKSLRTSSQTDGVRTLRKALVIFQFCISSGLILVTLVIFSQWNMLQSQKYSFDSEEIINIPVNSLKIRNNFAVIKSELLRNADVKTVSGCNKNFISELTSFNGLTVPEREGYIDMYYASIDGDFFDLYGKSMVSGRNFIDYSKDSLGGIILNESAARLINKTPDQILGLTVDVYDGYTPKVIGVVEDFQFQSLHGGIVPMYFQLFQSKEVADLLKVISLKVNTDHISETLISIETIFKSFDEAALFDYSFLNYDIRLAYKAETQFSQSFTFLTIVAILISCLGTFGLTTAITNQRKKELGVRKVLGASSWSIVLLINKSFVILVLVANLIAFPIALMTIRNWLQNFAYQVEVSGLFFLVVLFISLSFAVLSSGFWSIKAATSNPVDSLRTE